MHMLSFMEYTAKQLALKDIQTLPWIGKKSSEWLYGIGIRKAIDLKGANPQELYNKLEKAGYPTFDRIMLYVLRCAVYSVTEPHPKKHLLKWWNWKD